MLIYILLACTIAKSVSLVPPRVSSQSPKKTQNVQQINILPEAPFRAGCMFLSLPILPVLAAEGERNLALSLGRPVLDTFVNVLSLLMICRTVLSWYPRTDLKEFPYSMVVWPTEPLLAPVRATIPPAFGVDVSSLVWVGILSFVREVFTGQQGILTLMEKYPDTF